MALDQATTQLLTQMAQMGGKPLQEMTPFEARAGEPLMASMFGPGPDMLRVENMRLSTSRSGSFRVRTLVPQEEPRGVILYLHGGGWVVGSIDLYDAAARHLAAASGYAVVLADYRKAPEYAYPVPVEDAWRALTWTSENIESIAGRTVPLVVAGDSAGANLAAVITHRARDESGPAIAAQVLVYPVTDADFDTPSYLDPANQLALSRDSMIWFWGHYAPEDMRNDADLSPLRSASFADLPPAIVLQASDDVLRSEGEAYADALEAAGVPVRRRVFEGQMHGFFHMVNVLPASADGIAYIAESLADISADTVVYS
ncbi:alpha/beta hydrolase [Microbacterium sp. No. 7]|uniref:alpha/beta hydrolase n=1 Tax=Microbacterium sp. No. 7 TaxID=1714373 RepID=UPI0006CF37AB|nr:alpha/beta hydrolase [Microbacterium sp. No. 7]ALJ22345.1 esterase [Microbacterium sp. No. 7]